MTLSPTIFARLLREKLPRYVWPLAAVFFIVVSVLLLDHFRTYSSEVTLMVVHKNERMAGAADQVVETVARLPLSLSFYDQLLKRYPEVEDPWTGYGAPDREALWAEHVSTERLGKSNLIKVRVAADTEEDATLLAKRVAANVFQSVSRYYDIRTEVEVRSVDGPVTAPGLDHWAGWILLSVGLGFSLAFALASGFERLSDGFDALPRTVPAADPDLSAKIRDMLRPKKEDYASLKGQLALGSSAPLHGTASDDRDRNRIDRSFVPPSADAAQPVEVSREGAPEASGTEPVRNAELKEQADPSAEEEPVPPRPAAPSNLPFLDEGVSLEQYLFRNAPDSGRESEGGESLEASSKAGSPPGSVRQEPSEEELRRRLNQLLRGEV
jgi:hypothetical protein